MIYRLHTLKIHLRFHVSELITLNKHVVHMVVISALVHTVIGATNSALLIFSNPYFMNWTYS